MSEKWDRWFMGLARYAATASKDPSTKVGAVLVGADRRDVAFGYNGFPPGIADTAERLADRAAKYKLMQHAERNCLDNALFPANGATLYCTSHPCLRCSLSIASKRVRRVVCPPAPPVEAGRWTEEIPDARAVLAEAGVEVLIVDEIASPAPPLYFHYDEGVCPGHVASRFDPKVCGLCGVHVDSLR